MLNRHNNTPSNNIKDLVEYYKTPSSHKQKQYEAIRSIVIDNQPIGEVANRFGYKKNSLYSLIRDAKAGKIELFPLIDRGPKQRRTSVETQKKIIEFRKQGKSSTDIQFLLADMGINISARTVERILKDSGYAKLKRRTNNELGKTKSNKIIPERAEHLDLSKLEPFKVDVPVAGVYFFLPYIIDSEIIDIIKECCLPETKDIGSIQANLSMLLIKLIGCKRLSSINTYDQEPGLAIFSGLNILPKATYMSTYSCRCSEAKLIEFQSRIVDSFRKKYPAFFNSNFINLDFHSIPHYGDESEMEEIWCGARGKTMKGANTVFVQDSQSNTILYTRSDILRKEEANEVKKFVEFWKNIKGNIDETLVFDCRFTTYKVLDNLNNDNLNNDNIKFITLRKRHASLLEKTAEIPKENWKKVYLPIPKRRYKNILVYEDRVKLRDCKSYFRQIIVKNNGRSTPTFIITNNWEISQKDVLEIYAKRWHVENKIGELVMFFNLNALSSPVMIRIHYDILWTMIADTIYHLFAQDLRRFEKSLAPRIFKNFVDMPGTIIYDGEKFLVKIRKRAYTPVLLDVPKLNKPISIPWLDNRTLEIVWTA